MKPTRQFVWNKTSGRCFYCGMHLTDDTVDTIVRRDGPVGYSSWMEVDHVHPRSKGGLDTIENLVPSCQACNATKAGKSLEEYRQFVALKKDGRPKLTVELVEWLTSHHFNFPPLSPHRFWFEDNGFVVPADRATSPSASDVAA